MRWALALAAALVLAGCGAGTVHRGAGAAPILPDAPAPQIASVDRPAPDWVLGILQPPSAASESGVDGVVSQGSTQYCFSWKKDEAPTTPSSGGCSSTATPEQLAQLAASEQAQRAATAPAAGSEPRIVATLPVAGGGTASFVFWTAKGGVPCWTTDVEFGSGGGGSGPTGACTTSLRPQSATLMPPCDTLCLGSSGGGASADDLTFVLAGTVPAGAQALRVTRADGSAATYPLVGPVLPGFADRRIFLLDLGASDWRTLELVSGGAVTRTVTMPAEAAAAEDCQSEVGPAPQPSMGTDRDAVEQQLHSYDDALNACEQAQGSAQLLPSFPSSQARPTTTP